LTLRFRPALFSTVLLSLAAAIALQPVAAAPPSGEVRGKAWWAHVQAIANDGMEGRLAGSPGYARAADYVIGQLKAIGLKPAGVDGFRQPVELVEQRFDFANSRAALFGPAGDVGLSMPDDFYVRGSQPMPETIDAPMIFLGYGLSIPEAGHDDFAGVDVKGKVVVILAGGPTEISGALKSNARSEASRILVARGALGVIGLTTPAKVEIPWARQILIARAASMGFADPTINNFPSPFMSGSIDPAKAEALFAGSGHSFAELSALSDASKPLPSFALAQRFRATIVAKKAPVHSFNIIAKLPGSDPKLAAENVVLSAHLDGLGIGEPIDGDPIYNGALDNASGVASLIEIAKVLKAGKAPKRTILFTIVTGEEKGLLGSRYFARRPTVPKASLVADLNFDMALPIFALKNVTPLGYGESTLGIDAAAVAKDMGMAILPDPFPDRNTFTRSDQFSFIREGIPALFFKYGFTAGTPEAAIEKAWRANIYHSPKDDLNQPVMPVEAVKLDDYVAALATRVANAPDRPHWNADSFFKRFATSP